jgi:hypothetical protein
MFKGKPCDTHPSTKEFPRQGFSTAYAAVSGRMSHQGTFIAAPALNITFMPAGFSAARVPVQRWRAAQSEPLHGARDRAESHSYSSVTERTDTAVVPQSSIATTLYPAVSFRLFSELEGNLSRSSIPPRRCRAIRQSWWRSSGLRLSISARRRSRLDPARTTTRPAAREALD